VGNQGTFRKTDLFWKHGHHRTGEVHAGSKKARGHVFWGALRYSLSHICNVHVESNVAAPRLYNTKRVIEVSAFYSIYGERIKAP
jgi:hypothetical protein